MANGGDFLRQRHKVFTAGVARRGILGQDTQEQG